MIKQIGSEEISAKLARGEKLVFIEVSSLESFDHAHVPRALHLRPGELHQWAESYLPNPGVEIILYGENDSDTDVLRTETSLRDLGYLNLFHLEGGKSEWIRGGFPIDSIGFPPGVAIQEEFQGSDFPNAVLAPRPLRSSATLWAGVGAIAGAALVSGLFLWRESERRAQAR